MPRNKPRSPNIGHVKCPNPVHKKDTICAVRRKSNGTYYAMCPTCGQVGFNQKAGQEYYRRNMKIWDDPANPPAELPHWIRAGLAMPKPGEIPPEVDENGEDLDNPEPRAEREAPNPEPEPPTNPEPRAEREAPKAEPEPPPEKPAKGAGSLADLLPW